MTTTESRLRDLLATLADPVEPEPAWQDRVEAAVRATSRTRPRRRSRRAAAPRPVRRRPARRLVPALVAVLVLLIVTGAVVLTQTSHRDSDDPPAAPVTTPTAKPRVAPPYFLLLDIGQGLTIRNAATGVVTATVQAPNPKEGWYSVDTSADPSVFYAVTTAWESDTYPPSVKLYRLVVDGAGRLVSSTPVYSWRGPAAVRVSPDGTHIAFQRDTSPAGISVVDLSTGRTKTFTLDGAGNLGNLISMRWSGDGRQFIYAFMTDDTSTPLATGVRTGFWALDTTRAGGDLLAASRWVATYDWLNGHEVVATVDARGTHSYVATFEDHHPEPRGATVRVVEVDPATGRQVRVLLDVIHQYDWTGPWKTGELAVDPSGGFLMYNDGDHLLDAIDLATGHVSAIPLDGAGVRAFAW